MRRATALRYTFGAVLAAIAVYASTRRLQSADLVDALGASHGHWIAAAVLSVLFTLAVVTARWRLLVAAPSGIIHWRLLWNAVVLGQAVNILAPLRVGEGARIVYTCRVLNLPAPRVIAAAILERVLDIAAFAAAVLAFLAAGWLPKNAESNAAGAATLAILTVVTIAIFFRVLPALAAWVRGRGDRLSRLAHWLERQASAVETEWTETTRRKHLVMVSGITAAILLSSATTNFLVFRAFELAVPLTAAVILLVVLQVGTAVVSVPGNIGVFHYLTVLTLAQWQVPAPQALAAAIVLHAVSIGPKILLAPLALIDRPADA